MTPRERWDVDRIIKEKKLNRMSSSDVKKLLEQYKGKDKKDTIREVMSRYRLVVDGEELNALLGKK